MEDNNTLDVTLISNNTLRVFSGNNSINVFEITDMVFPSLLAQDGYKQYIGLGGRNVHY